MEPLNQPKTHHDYAVAIICAMSFEMTAVRYMLDREHARLPKKDDDNNIYILGEMGEHNVVLACLPGQQGKSAAAVVATNLCRTFPSIKWHFLVGIGGGIPNTKHDIRLGDVVVSMPEGTYGGVAQYDLGKATETGFTFKGFLHPPPELLRSAIEVMRSDHFANDNKIETFVSGMQTKGRGFSVFQRPKDNTDVLFREDYLHIPNTLTCHQCDPSKVVQRPEREYPGAAIHYGLIASGDSVIKSSAKRNEIVRSLGDVLCLEMEAAGLMSQFPCLVIRGISDYADSHKNDEWHHYAAAAAAACTKELLSYFESKQESANPTASPGTAPPANLGPGGGTITFTGRGIQHAGSGNATFGDVNIS